MKTLREKILSLNQDEIFSKYLLISVDKINWSTISSMNKVINVYRGESTPSMSFKWYGDKLIARDFGDMRYSGDVFKVVGFIIDKDCTNSSDFVDICYDILENYHGIRPKKNSDYEIIQNEGEIKVIDTIDRSIQKRDYDYFNSFGILNRTIEGVVFPVSRYSINGKVTGYRNSHLDPCYRYVVNHKFTKLYFPNRDRKSKFPRFITNNILQFDDITSIRKCRNIIIVKSIKDKLLLNQMLCKLGCRDVIILTASSETSTFNAKSLSILREYCAGTIYVMYDVDSTGLNSMEILEKAFGFKSLIFSTKAKDPTDYCRAFGYASTFDIFKTILLQILQN